MVGEDARGVLVLVGGVVLTVPGDDRAEDVAHSHVKTAISGAQRSDAKAVVDHELARGEGGRRGVEQAPHGVETGAHAAFAFRWARMRSAQVTQYG